MFAFENMYVYAYLVLYNIWKFVELLQFLQFLQSMNKNIISSSVNKGTAESNYKYDYTHFVLTERFHLYFVVVLLKISFALDILHSTGGYTRALKKNYNKTTTTKYS